MQSIAKKIFAVGSTGLMVASLVPSVAFAASHAIGTNVKFSDGTVGTVTTENSKTVVRQYTSAGAFLSYGFNTWSTVVDANSDDMALPKGSFLPPRDGSLITSDRGADMGTTYVITAGKKAGFTSAQVFKDLGFKFENGMKGDLSWMSSDANIDSSTAAHRPGTLVNVDGGIFLVRQSDKLGIADPATFYSWGYNFKETVMANSADRAIVNASGVMGMRAPGDFSPSALAGTGSTGSTGSTSVAGPFQVSVASDSPAAQVLINGQALADLAHFTFSGTGTLSSVTLKRGGISNQDTLTNLYVFDGNVRVSDGNSFNTMGETTITGLNLPISGSKTLSIKADVYGSANSGTISVALAKYMTVGASGMTDVNSWAATHAITNAGSNTLATAAFTGASSSTVTATTINAGTTAYTVWSAPLQINTRTVQLKGANFRVTGSAPADALSNIKLFIDGADTSKTASIVTVNGTNYANFDLNSAPISLNTGSHTLSVRADIVKGSSFNFTYALQNASDLMIYDPQVGVNIAVTGTGYIPNASGMITIGTGTSTFVLDPTFASTTTVTGGASNVPLARFKLRGYGEDVKVTALSIVPCISTTSTCTPGTSYQGTTASGTDSGLQNVTLYFNGSQVGSQTSTWGASSATTIALNLGSQLIIPAGQDSILEVRADLRSAAGTNYTAGYATARILATGDTAEGVSSKSSLDLVTSNVTGNTLTVQTGLLAVSKNTGYANQTVAPNTAGVKIGSFSLQNQSSSEAVRVTGLTVALAYGAGAGSTNLSGLRTSETSGSAGTPVQPSTAAASATGTNSFSTDFELAAGATKTIDILADSSAAAGVTVTVIPTLTVTSIGKTSNVSQTSTAAVGQTITFNSGTLATPTLATSSSTTAQYVAAGNGGAADASKASYTFVSTGGSSTISELKFTVTGTDTVQAIKVGSASAPVVGGIAYLTGLNIAVPNGGSGSTVDALVSYSEVGTNGVTPGSTSQIALSYVKYTSGSMTTTLTPSVSANIITLVGSKPALTIPSTTDTGLSISGVGKIGQVTISADAKGAIKINDIVFTVGSSGFSTAPTAVAGALISDSTGATAVASSACTAASLVVTCEFGTTANTDFDGYQITAGSSKTFTLYGSLTGAAATGSGTPTITTSVGASTFNWDDSSTNGGAGSVNLSGTLIYNFPSTSYSIKQ